MKHENDGFSRISRVIESLPSFITKKANVGECLELLGFIKNKLSIKDIDEAIEVLKSGKVKIYPKVNSKNSQKYMLSECCLIVYVEMQDYKDQ